MGEYKHFKYFSCHVVLFFLLATPKESIGAPQLGTPAVDFIRHSVVQPIVHHGRSKRGITSTRDTTGEHHKQVSVTVNVDGEEYVLDLSLNEHLVARDHVISYLEKGQTVLRTPTKEELDICQYSGTVRGKPGSWVAVSTCRGISGVIHDGDSMKYIEPAGEERINGQHFLYDHADLKTSHDLKKNTIPENNVTSPRLLKRHSSEQILEQGSSRIKREADSFNFEKRYVELVLVADNDLFKDQSASVTNMNRYFMDITNIVNSLYAPLNINITLVGVVVWYEQDEIHIHEKDIFITLENFAEYSKTTLLPKRDIDHAHLLTCQLYNKTGGFTYPGGICTDNGAVGVTTKFSPIIGQVASVVAHELGHNLGMDHNTAACNCSDNYCIMSETITVDDTPTQWSDCNKRDLAAVYANDKDYCLRNPSVPSSFCGNGLVEGDEQCDCGPNSGPLCTECCYARLCKYINSLECFLRALTLLNDGLEYYNYNEYLNAVSNNV